MEWYSIEEQREDCWPESVNGEWECPIAQTGVDSWVLILVAALTIAAGVIITILGRVDDS